jgi:hypothetical protein
MFNVYQHWDPLKVCIVGKSYAPEFYSFITSDIHREGTMQDYFPERG